MTNEMKNTRKMSIDVNIIDRTPAMRANFRHMEFTKTHAHSDREQRIANNYRLAVKIALQYQNCGLELEDLIGFAYLGLTEAADHFDAGRGLAFSPYACWWIRKEVIQGLSNTGHHFRLPVRAQMMASKLKREKERFYAKNGRDATAEEMAIIMGVSLEEVYMYWCCLRRFQSLDQPVSSDEEGETLADTIALQTDIEQPIDQALRRQQGLAQLNERQRAIAEALQKGVDIRTIAQQHKITPTRVRQIRKDITQYLRL